MLVRTFAVYLALLLCEAAQGRARRPGVVVEVRANSCWARVLQAHRILLLKHQRVAHIPS
jgi:hypothetical protein